MSMYTDAPILDTSNDLLGRAPFARYLADFLTDLPDSHSTVVALQGRWGSGKTSLLNMTIKQIEQRQQQLQQQPIIVKFDPWNCVNEEQIISGFFASLRSTLAESLTGEKAKQALSSISKALSDYAFVLSPLDSFLHTLGLTVSLEEASAAIGEALQDKLSLDNNTVKLKESVSKELEKAGLTAIVVIDDIDRLPNRMICLLFQLVAQIADFPRVHYILAYDPDIVTRAIHEIQNCKGSEYLEKVVQLPLDVPQISRQALYRILHDEMQGFINCNYDDDDLELERAERVLFSYVGPFLRSMRDLRRYQNLYLFEYSFAGKHMSAIDLAALVALKVFTPEILPWIDSNLFRLCGASDGESSTESNDASTELFDQIAQALSSKSAQTMPVIMCLDFLFPKFANSHGQKTNPITDQQLRMNARCASVEVWTHYRNGLLDKWKYPREEIKHLLLNGTKEEILGALNGSIDAVDFGEELRGLISMLDAQRAEIVAVSLLDTIRLSDSTTDNSYLGSLHDNTLKELFGIIGRDKSAALFSDSISNSSLAGLVQLANMLRMEERAHGRLGADNTRPDKQLFAESSLPDIESRFVTKVEHLCEHENVLLISGNRTLLYLWRSFDPDAEAQYIEQKRKEDPLNTVALCEECAGSWQTVPEHSNGNELVITSWTINRKSLRNYIDIQTVQSEIDDARRKREFWELSDKRRYAAAAVYIGIERNLISEDNEIREIEQSDVLKLIEQWRDEYNAQANRESNE